MVSTILLKPAGQIDLDHRAWFLRGTPQQSLFVAVSQEGRVSVLDAQLTLTRSFISRAKIRAISPHPLDRFAIISDEDGSLSVTDAAGTIFVYFAAPPVSEGAPSWVKPEYYDCRFDESGDFLWTAARLSSNEVQVQLIETNGWSIAAVVPVQDPFNGSFCYFHQTADGKLTSLWLTAGDDTQHIYWLTREGHRFIVTPEACLINNAFPFFSPSSNRFLILNEDASVSQYRFPRVAQLGTSLGSWDDNDAIGSSACYLDDEKAMLATNEGRMFIVNLDEMNVQRELALSGHEPDSIGKYFPRLAHEDGIGTNITEFRRIANVILFVYRRDQGVGLDVWKDSLLWLPVEPILRSMDR